jgi:peptide-methionine (R)-S-oxide reductase
MRNALAIILLLGILGAGVLWWSYPAPQREGIFVNGKIVKSDAEWRQQLTDEQYRVTRKKGTERAFTGAYADCHTDGIYECVCCGQPLFDAQTKFDSGTGWPSYWQPIAPDRVALLADRGWLGVRTEVVCSRCDAHLGHVFDDGPLPTRKRFCMNSAALHLVERSPDTADEKQ